MDSMNDYEVVGSFDWGDKSMVAVKAAHGTHVMPSDEWEQMKSGLIKNYEKLRLKRENNKVA